MLSVKNRIFLDGSREDGLSVLWDLPTNDPGLHGAWQCCCHLSWGRVTEASPVIGVPTGVSRGAGCPGPCLNSGLSPQCRTPMT